MNDLDKRYSGVNGYLSTISDSNVS